MADNDSIGRPAVERVLRDTLAAVSEDVTTYANRAFEAEGRTTRSIAELDLLRDLADESDDLAALADDEVTGSGDYDRGVADGIRAAIDRLKPILGEA